MKPIDNFLIDRHPNIAQAPRAASPSSSPAPEFLDASLRNAITAATAAQLRNALSEICTKSFDARQLVKSLLQSTEASSSPKIEKSP
jgi:hypothetical protein